MKGFEDINDSFHLCDPTRREERHNELLAFCRVPRLKKIEADNSSQSVCFTPTSTVMDSRRSPKRWSYGGLGALANRQS